MSSSLGVVDILEEFLANSFVSIFLSAGIYILLKRSRELNGLSIVRIVYLDKIG